MRYYYANENNQAVGPVTEADLKSLQMQGILKHDTFIIKEGGDSWIKLEDVHDGKQPEMTNVTSLSSPIPAALAHTIKTVDHTIVWVTAFVPLAALVLNAKFVSMGISTWFSVPIILTINGLMLSSDMKKLKAQGYSTESIGSAWLVPVYLFKRVQLVGGGYGYAVCWMITFFVSLL